MPEGCTPSPGRTTSRCARAPTPRRASRAAADPPRAPTPQALLPLCIGRRWWTALTTGLYWGARRAHFRPTPRNYAFSDAPRLPSLPGLGHGIGAALVGALAFCLRSALNLDALTTYMEAAVGISIMIIGVNGIAEAREWREDHEESAVDGGASLSDVAVDAPGIMSTLGTGILHGCSGSGHLLGVMPALAMPTWVCAAAYLGCFGLGTMIAMALFTGAVGEASVQMGERLNQPDVPAKLSMLTSLFALTMGALWTLRASLELRLPQASLRLLRRAAAA